MDKQQNKISPLAAIIIIILTLVVGIVLINSIGTLLTFTLDAIRVIEYVCYFGILALVVVLLIKSKITK